MLHVAIEVRSKGTIHNNGLFTNKIISKGEVIWELTDPTYTWEEIEKWDEDRRKDFNWYGFQCGIDRFSSPKGMSREMNHSCDPNTWWKGSDVLIAKRDIFPDEEITYDYASCDIDIVFEISCHCGSTLCRGKVTNKDHLSPEWQKQYGENLPPHVLSAIRNT